MIELFANLVALSILILIVSMWFVMLKFIIIPVIIDSAKIFYN